MSHMLLQLFTPILATPYQTPDAILKKYYYKSKAEQIFPESLSLIVRSVSKGTEAIIISAVTNYQHI